MEYCQQIRQNIYVDNSHMQQRTLGASVKAKISEQYPVLDLLQRTLRFVKISQSQKNPIKSVDSFFKYLWSCVLFQDLSSVM